MENKSVPILRNIGRWKVGFLNNWKVSGIITNAAKLSKPTYDLGHGIGSAGSPSNFAYLLGSQREIEVKALYSEIALKFFAMKAKHDKFISQKNNSYHDDTVELLVMFAAYAMGHDNVPFDWRTVRTISEGTYTGLERNLDEYIIHNAPLIEQIRNEMSQFSVACNSIF